MAKLIRLSGDIIALHEYRALYFAIPKVANSSLKAICATLIRPSLDENTLATFWSDSWKPELFRHPAARDYLHGREILLSQRQLLKYLDYWKFCIVRNPWDRLVSCWTQKTSDATRASGTDLNGVARCLRDHGFSPAGMTFSQFVAAVATIPDEAANPHFRSQYTFVTDKRGTLVVDFVGHMETLNADLKHIFRTVGIPETNAPHLLRSDRHAYAEYYGRETADLVRQRFARDISLFQYAFNPGQGAY